MSRSPFQVLVIPYLIETDKTRYACLKRSDEHYWQFIAGGGEDNESPLEAATREAMEEAGINATSTLLPLESVAMIPAENVSELLRDKVVIPEYSFAVPVQSRHIILSKEHSEYRWCDYETACGLVKWESNRVALKELRRTMTDYLIRPAQLDDALNFTALSIQVWLDTYATDGLRDALSRYVLREFTEETSRHTISDPEERVFVAERDNHLIGYIQATTGSKSPLVESPRQAEINRVYVQERFTRSGIGSAMMAEMETVLFSEGTEVIWLTAWVGNSRARAFYPKIGYTDIGSVDWEDEGERYENRVFVKMRGLVP